MDHHIAKNDEYGRRVGLARERLRAALQRPQDLHAAGGLRSTLDQWLQARCAVARDWDRSPVRSAEPLVAAVALVLLVEGLQVYAALASVYALALCFLASSEYARLARCWDASGRLGDLLREADTRQFVAPTSDTAPTAPVLECRSLRYGAISGIDLVVHGGDRIAIVGDTGSGKSTMARLLLGQLTPMRGRVLVAGDDVAALLEPERRLRVTGVLADALPMDGTLLTNISASAHSLHREEALRAWSHLGLREWIEEMPLGERTPVAQQGTGWSDHQRRLMTLAPLLVKPAQCLVIDCTLDVLDFRRARSIMRSIASLPCAIVLFTARPEIVSKEYARYTLRGGALGG